MIPPSAVFIMAGGTDEKWTDLGGQGRRHFQLIGRETVLGRIVRQLRERGVSQIAIIAPAELVGYYRTPGANVIAATSTGWGCEALNGWSDWPAHGRILYLYGDTVFSAAAMDRILAFRPQRFQAFGRHGPGGVSPSGELFGFSFPPAARLAWRHALRMVFELKAKGVIRRAGTWEAYRFMAGARGRVVGRHLLYPRCFTDIRDGTDDFDTPEQYRALVELVEAGAGRF